MNDSDEIKDGDWSIRNSDDIRSDIDGTIQFYYPLSFEWIPKEDITAYELAQALPYLLGQPLFERDLNDPSNTFSRHMKIV